MTRLGATGERVTVGTAPRLVNLTEATADPAVGAISQADAQATLRDALKRLPTLARRPAPAVAASPQAFGAPSRVTLAPSLRHCQARSSLLLALDFFYNV